MTRQSLTKLIREAVKDSERGLHTRILLEGNVIKDYVAMRALEQGAAFRVFPRGIEIYSLLEAICQKV
jgi:hypothetical protein